MNTDTRRIFKALSVFICVYLWLLSSCAPEPAFTPFVPPSNQISPTSTGATGPAIAQVSTPTQLPSQPTNTPAAPLSTETALPCTADLDFVQDLTIPDGSVLTAGSSIDKQWQVTNSGTCNWDSSYRLKMIFGDAMGASVEQALYPAKAGTQAILRVVFTAPLEEGTYQSQWQAFGPDGTAFGDAVFMQIVVSP